MIEFEKTADNLPWLGGDERWVTSVAAVRAIDADAADAGLPTAVLMENAGRSLLGVCEALRERAGAAADVVIGPGANGGDGLVLARYLMIHGWRVRVVHGSGDGMRPDPVDAPWRSAKTAGVPMFTLGAARGGAGGNGLVVDAVFGVGLSRPPRDEARELVEYVNGRAADGATVLAVDVPSGLEADTGEALVPGATVVADVTATFIGTKPGFASGAAGRYLGRVVVLGIGVPEAIIRRHAGSAGASEVS